MPSNDEDRLERSIVCGVDASDGARIAVRVAARLAAELGLRLVVAHVVQPQPARTGLGPTATQLETLPLDTLRAGGEALVDRILKEERLGETERRVVLGFPADRLADLADDEGAELIVVGSRGRRGFKAAWLGSVSADVIAVARCPVLVVPPGVAPASAVGGGRRPRSGRGSRQMGSEAHRREPRAPAPSLATREEGAV